MRPTTRPRRDSSRPSGRSRASATARHSGPGCSVSWRTRRSTAAARRNGETTFAFGLRPPIVSEAHRRRRRGRDRAGWLARPGWRRSAGPSGRPAWQAIAAAAALVLVVFVASLVAFPSVRATVADWLGLRGIGISVVPSLAPLPTTYRSL